MIKNQYIFMMYGHKKCMKFSTSKEMEQNKHTLYTVLDFLPNLPFPSPHPYIFCRTAFCPTTFSCFEGFFAVVVRERKWVSVLVAVKERVMGRRWCSEREREWAYSLPHKEVFPLQQAAKLINKLYIDQFFNDATSNSGVLPG